MRPNQLGFPNCLFIAHLYLKQYLLLNVNGKTCNLSTMTKLEHLEMGEYVVSHQMMSNNSH